MRSPPSARLARIALLAILACFSLFPLLWMLSVSLMAPGEASQFPPPLLPEAPGLSAYRALFATTGIAAYFLNSLIVATLGTLLSLAFNATAGYAFAKLRFRGRDRIFQLLLAALVIPAQVTMLPLFLMLKEIGLINSFAGVLVPVTASIFGIFLVRQYA
ncbi:MAG TPA: carbohydrate ABC transporter permease, partial [Sphingomicrobium sp.]|nr:carbohydrate ABC transporter permease [Sphingomicrobium sp.]